jgi:hypothetical protein
MNKLEINKKIALFNGDIDTMNARISFNKSCSIDELKYTESWDWLLPVYQKLAAKIIEFNDESFVYLEHQLYTTLDFKSMETGEFAEALSKIINEYDSELAKQ